MHQQWTLFFSLLLCAVCVCGASASTRYDSSVRLIGEAKGFSESFTLQQAIDELKGGDVPSKGSKAFLKLRFGFSVGHGNHEVGVYQRRETFIKHSQGAADFIYYDKNNIPLPRSAFYPVDIAVNNARFREYQYIYRRALNDKLSLSLGLSALQADDLIKGELHGFVSTDNLFSGLDFSWDALLDYYYREDYLLDRPRVIEPTANGYSTFVALNWQLSPKLKVLLQSQDPFSAIYWKAAPFTRASSTVSNAIGLDKAAVSGNVGYEKIKQRLNPYYLIEAQLTLQPNFYLSARSESLFGREWNYLGYRYQNKANSVFVRTCFETHALELGFSSEYLTIFAGADKFDVKKAHYANLGLSFHVRF